MTRIRRALQHELRENALARPRLDAHARRVTRLEATLEPRANAHRDRRAVAARHPEEKAAGLRRRERFYGLPAGGRREPAHEQQRLRGVDVASVHVDVEADAHADDLIEVRPPRG